MLAEVDDPNLSAFVVWVPRNGAEQKHVERVTRLVTDHRASHFWDTSGAVIDPYDDMLELTGPCAGILMVFGPDAEWGDSGPPEPDYLEDAHAREFDRPWPQFNAKRFAGKVRELLADSS